MIAGSLNIIKKNVYYYNELAVYAFTCFFLITSVYFFCNPTEKLQYLERTLKAERVKYFIYFKGRIY